MSLEEVMISLQKANIAFQGMIKVRNRLVEAYKEVASLQL
jgi:flagellar hook-basal body complex protein FliE